MDVTISTFTQDVALLLCIHIQQLCLKRSISTNTVQSVASQQTVMHLGGDLKISIFDATQYRSHAGGEKGVS